MRVVTLRHHADLDEWRDAARALLVANVPPDDVQWSGADAGDLFAPPDAVESSPPRDAGALRAAPRVPRDFVDLADDVIAHSDRGRHALLYRMLWRLTHGEPRLLDNLVDDDIVRARTMAKAVTRDRHKMKAFVRFREVATDDGPRFIAWFEPDHFIVESTAPFFVRRFTGMRWLIATPYASAQWDGETLRFGPGARKDLLPAHDAMEDAWRTYYENIFNPARLNVAMMGKEMPQKYWRNLPEAHLIPRLVRDARERTGEMIQAAPTTPRKRVATRAPAEVEPVEPARSIAALRREARDCRRCELYRFGTQTVFGEGPDDARVMLVGEQPGDKEDLAGRPFVGPAGQMLDRALEEIGIARESLYLTNAVKHFKFEPRGKVRLHKRAALSEQRACHLWLEREIATLQPKVIVALGATGANAVFGKDFRLMAQRGEWQSLPDGRRGFATVHPSWLLRVRDDERDEAYAGFVRDLSLLKRVKLVA